MPQYKTFTYGSYKVPLGWADYMVFVPFMAFTALSGLLFWLLDRRRIARAGADLKPGDSQRAFQLGGGQMHPVMVALSLMSSSMSSLYLVVAPTECYNYGLAYAYVLLSYFIAFPLYGRIMLPIFFGLKQTSMYEYLEYRFHRYVRKGGAVIYVISVLLYLTIILYAPASTVETVTLLPVWASILLCGGVCIIYTTLGGMKATIWNDIVQIAVVVTWACCMIGFGHKAAGDPAVVREIAKNGSRMEFKNFDPDPTARNTFWTQIVGGFFLYFSLYTCSQTVFQKLRTCSSLESAIKATTIVCFPAAAILSLLMWVALVMYAYYSECDPLLDGRISEATQILPLYMLDITGEYDGLPGLFITAMYSACLGSMSSNLNSVSGVILTDLVNPIHKKKTGDNIEKETLVCRIIIIVFGCTAIGLANASHYFGIVAVEFLTRVGYVVVGPFTGLFILGIFTPFVNAVSASVATFISLIMVLWPAIGSFKAHQLEQPLPLSVVGCPSTLNDTLAPPTAFLPDSTTFGTVPQYASPNDVLWVYRVNHMYWAMAGIVMVLIIGPLLSLATGLKKDVPEKQIFACADKCCCCCPANVRECIRCGSLPAEEQEEDIEIITMKYLRGSMEVLPGVDGFSNPDALFRRLSEAEATEHPPPQVEREPVRTLNHVVVAVGEVQGVGEVEVEMERVMEMEGVVEVEGRRTVWGEDSDSALGRSIYGGESTPTDKPQSTGESSSPPISPPSNSAVITPGIERTHGALPTGDGPDSTLRARVSVSKCEGPDPSLSRTSSITKSKGTNPSLSRTSSITKSEGPNPSLSRTSSIGKSEGHNPSLSRTSSITKSEGLNPSLSRTSSITKSEGPNLSLSRTSSIGKSKGHNPSLSRTSSITKSEGPNLSLSRTSSITKSEGPNPSLSRTSSIAKSEGHNPSLCRTSSITESEGPNPSLSSASSLTKSEGHNLNLSRTPSLTKSEGLNPSLSRTSSITKSEGPNPNISRTPSLSKSERSNPSLSRTVSLSKSEGPIPCLSRNVSMTKRDGPRPSLSRTLSLTKSEGINPSLSRTSSVKKSENPNVSLSRTHSLTKSEGPNPSLSRTHSLTKDEGPSPTLSGTHSLSKSEGPNPIFSRTRSLTKSESPSSTFSRTSSVTKGECPNASLSRTSYLRKSEGLNPSLSRFPSITKSESPHPSLNRTPSLTNSEGINPSLSRASSLTKSEGPNPSLSKTHSLTKSEGPSPSLSRTPSLSKSGGPNPSLSRTSSLRKSVSLTPSLSRSPSITTSESPNPSLSRTSSVTKSEGPSPSFRIGRSLIQRSSSIVRRRLWGSGRRRSASSGADRGEEWDPREDAKGETTTRGNPQEGWEGGEGGEGGAGGEVMEGGVGGEGGRAGRARKEGNDDCLVWTTSHDPLRSTDM